VGLLSMDLFLQIKLIIKSKSKPLNFTFSQIVHVDIFSRQNISIRTNHLTFPGNVGCHKKIGFSGFDINTRKQTSRIYMKIE